MNLAPEISLEEFFSGHTFAREVHTAVSAILTARGPHEVRATQSQVAYRRRHAFAWLWIPARYVAAPAADVVLSVALGRHDPSPRFKEVAHPSQRHWRHHLEVRSLDHVDDDVVGWLQEAYDRAG